MDGLVYRAARQSESDPFDYVLSDETVDRYGEVIDAAGWDLSEFRADRNPIALFNHNRDAIIGRWENVRIKARQLLGRLVLAEEGTSAIVDEVRKHWRQGNLRAVSVGFQPLEKKPIDDKADDHFGPFRYLRQQLVEASLVAVPANPNALQVSRSFALPADARRQLFGKPAAQEQRTPSVVHRVPARPLASASIPMKLSEKITAAQADINRMRDTLTAINEKDIVTAEEQTQADDLAERIPETIAELERLQARERALTIQIDTRGAVEPAADRGRPFAAPAKKITPSDYLIRAAVVNLITHVTHKTVDQVLAERYPDEITGIVVRAAVNPATTVFPTWATELVETAVGDFMNLLMPLSLYQPLSGRGSRFTFDRAGAIKIPARSATPTIAGSFIGEGAPIPVRRAGLTSVTLTPKKMGVISTFTRELAQHSTPSIEQVIRQAMAEDTAVAIDTILIDTNAATTIRPAGLRNGVSGLTPSALAPNQAMVADLKALLGAITAVNGGRDVVVMINPAQGLALSFVQTTTGDFMFSGVNEAGQRLGVTFIQSTTIPAAMVIAVDAADFASATGDTPEFDVSDQATIHEEDTTPLPIGSTGTPTVVAAPTRSLWQTASLGVRMLLDINWAMRRTGMVSWMSPVVW
jgi:HK97 family phage prohead protease/HK97 family phage major capsid protein